MLHGRIHRFEPVLGIFSIDLLSGISNIIIMENKKNLKQEIVEGVREELGFFRKEIKNDISEIKTDITGLKTDVSGLKTDVSELKADVSGLKTDVNELKTDVSGLKAEMGEVKVEIRKLGVQLETMDNKFALLSEGQEIIHDILETRVANIEELLGIEATA